MVIFSIQLALGLEELDLAPLALRELSILPRYLTPRQISGVTLALFGRFISGPD